MLISTALTLGSPRRISNAWVDLFFIRPAADIKEVRRDAARILNDIHRGHREARAVHHAADVAVELDIVQVVFEALTSRGSSSVGSRILRSSRGGT